MRLLDAHDGEVGWDIFSLEYHIKNSPIEVMLYARDKRGDNKFWGSAGYRRIFAFLWKLKRVEYMVSCLLLTVTFNANHAHNLTRSP